jgi:hypothetical protein
LPAWGGLLPRWTIRIKILTQRHRRELDAGRTENEAMMCKCASKSAHSAQRAIRLLFCVKKPGKADRALRAITVPFTSKSWGMAVQ